MSSLAGATATGPCRRTAGLRSMCSQGHCSWLTAADESQPPDANCHRKVGAVLYAITDITDGCRRRPPEGTGTRREQRAGEGRR
jgi:hypothetical protein